MALEVRINGKRLDISKSRPIALTFVTNDIAELRNIQGNHSNRFKIPMTQGNRDILELADNLNSDTLLPYRFQAATVTQDGVQIMPNATLELKQTRSQFEAIILDGNMAFFDLIKDKRLSDLDFSAFDHTWNLNTVVASRNNTADDGYIYPLINYGNLDVSKTFDVRFQFTSFFFKTIFDEIMKVTGYTVSGNILTREVESSGSLGLVKVKIWEELIIAFSNDEFPATFGSTVEIKDILPDMTQTEFLKGVFQMLGIMPQVNSLDKTIQLIQLRDILANRDKALNWGQKMDVSQKPLIEYSAGNYAQVNRLRYIQDSLNSEFGTGSLRVDDQTLVGERTMFQVPFAPTLDAPGINFLETIDIPQIIKLDSDQELTISTEPRILFMRRGPNTDIHAVSPNGVDYTDGTTTINIDGNDAPYCQFDKRSTLLMSLDFDSDDGLITAHYKVHRDNLLVLPKTITQRFVLDQVDINALDHSIPIYLPEFNDYFYLNKINNYIGGRLTSVNLKRL